MIQIKRFKIQQIYYYCNINRFQNQELEICSQMFLRPSLDARLFL